MDPSAIARDRDRGHGRATHSCFATAAWTTLFTDTRSWFGRVDHSGPLLSDPGITHQLRQLDRGVTGKVWQFHRPNSVPISILLNLDGSIESDQGTPSA